MTTNMPVDRQVFEHARGISDPATRARYLDDACGTNLDLRRQVEALLQAHADHASFLEQPAFDPRLAATVERPGHEQAGTQIGPYKLLELIGEGGMGEVWIADQFQPIRRRVALKLIKPGMDSRSVLARFEAERQALALMDHPNIAKVLDAGTTPDQRPYFVMEVVKGTPITTFCDARRLSPRERLELFMPVCQAIQHAHTKGIIHRDIKPSNVLVALYDEKAVPKVIDFGVAKAVGQQLTEKTLYTGFGALVGTPAYMAPEQATFNQLDVDTRADVYALGVLLYELLAGSPPVEPERLKQAALDEVLRLVRDEEPPPPSQRLSTSVTRASIAAVRQTDPAKLAKLIRGELDWIVMKALEKDRARRYETANSFAADIQSYLSGEQVQAVPPSRLYKLRKLARKHLWTITTATAFALLLIAAVAISGSLAIQARRAERIAQDQRRRSEEDRDALEKALQETRAATQKAEHLTAETIVSRVSDEFTPMTLLQWTEQLNRISDGNPQYQDFLKLNLLGAIQFLATFHNYTGPTSKFPSTMAVHLLKDGLLAFSRNKTDLTLYDLRTRLPVLRLDQIAEGDASVEKVSASATTVVVCDSARRVHGFSRRSGARLYSAQFQEPCQDVAWPYALQVDVANSRGACSTKSANPKEQQIQVINLETGAVGSIPIALPPEEELKFSLSSDGRAIALMSENSSQVQIWDAVTCRLRYELPHPERQVESIAFSPDGNQLATFSYPRKAGDIQRLQVWNLSDRTVVANYEPATHPKGLSDNVTLKFLSSGVIANDQIGAWLDTPAVDLSQSTPRKLKYVTYKIVMANDRWLVTDDAQVLARDSLEVIETPRTKTYAEHLKEFALHQRYLNLNSEIIDLQVDRRFPGSYWEEFEYDEVSQRILCGNPGYFEMVLPVAPAAVSIEQVQAFVQLTACGELNPQGKFILWSEAEWSQKRQQAVNRGWLDELLVPHLADYFQQPAFYWKRRIDQLTIDAGKPTATARDQEQLANAWKQLQVRDQGFHARREYTNWFNEVNAVSPSQAISTELSLVNRYGTEYWRHQKFEPGIGHSPQITLSELPFWPDLSNAMGRDVIEYFRCQREYWQAKPPLAHPDGFLGFKRLFAEAYVFSRIGDHASALLRLDRILPDIPASPPVVSPEEAESSVGEATHQNVITLLMTRAVLLGELQRWKECQETMDHLKRWEPPAVEVAPHLEFNPMLLEQGVPPIILTRFGVIKAQLEKQPPTK